MGRGRKRVFRQNCIHLHWRDLGPWGTDIFTDLLWPREAANWLQTHTARRGQVGSGTQAFWIQARALSTALDSSLQSMDQAHRGTVKRMHPPPVLASPQVLATDSWAPKSQGKNRHLVAPFPASLTAGTNGARLYKGQARSASAEPSTRRFQLQPNGFKLTQERNSHGSIKNGQSTEKGGRMRVVVELPPKYKMLSYPLCHFNSKQTWTQSVVALML